MIWETYLLYTLPLLSRLALTTDSIPWSDVLLSQVSVLVVFPSTFLPAVVPDALREHVYRHAVYATAFSIAIPTTLHLEHLEGAFLTFCILGLVTLWWFVLSHWLENTMDSKINTHQGDITVLPLTLVAIGTFVLTVPDDVFRFTRSTIFFVPIIVAWATMFFIAFQDFALQCTTTHEHPAFMYYAYAALVVAIVHLVLIETNVSAHTYQFFPLIAALFCQCIPNFPSRPRLRPRRRPATLVCAIGASVAVYYAAMQFRVDEVWIFVVTNVCVALILPLVNGTRWVGPACLLATLATSNLYKSLQTTYDLIAIAACHYIVLFVTDWIARPVLHSARLSTGSTLVYDKHTGMGSVHRLRSLHVLEETGTRHARVATWRVPVLRLWYTEHEVTFQTREDRGDAVRAIVA
jgi:hypothetical protein